MPPSDTIRIAALTPADVDDYRRVRLRALAEHPESFRSNAEEEAARPLSWWQERLAPRPTSNVTILGARTAAGELVGTSGLLFETRRTTRHTATVVGMYVMPEHAGRGLGARLLEACVDVARADPWIEVLYLTVTTTNAGAIRLYERSGFVAYGREPNSMRIGDRTFDKLMMARFVRPEPANARAAT